MELAPRTAAVFKFGVFTLDAEKGELRRLNERIPLQEKPLQLLALLVESSGQLVTREEVRRRLWGADTFVEFDDSLNHAVKKLREALADSAGDPRFIKTVPRQGYRFLVPVDSEYVQRNNGESHGPPPAEERLPAPPAVNIRNRAPLRLLTGIGSVFLVVSCLMIAALARRESAAMPTSLLVLPFQSLDTDRPNHGIGQGITEQVTAKLMNLEDSG